MAKCFDLVGYQEPCNAWHYGYTGRAALFGGYFDGEGLHNSCTFSDNGMVLTEFYGEATWQAVFEAVKQDGGFAIPISIDANNPFPVQIQSNTDSGRVMFTKTIPCSIPCINEKEVEFIMGLVHHKKADMALVLESRVIKTVNGFICDIFGLYGYLHIDPASITRTEYENGSAWQFNLVVEEPIANVVSKLTDLPDALDKITA